MSDRVRIPVFVALIGVLYFLIGLFLLGTGAMMLIGGGEGGLIVAAPLLIAGLLTFVVGYGMLKGWKIMWYIGALVALLVLIFSAIGILAGMTDLIPVEGLMDVGTAAVLPFIAGLILMFYLTRPKVRAYFGF